MIEPSGKPLYQESYWAFIEEQAKADRIKYSRFVESLDDQNAAAIFDGYYLVNTSRLVPTPHEHWDPVEGYQGLELAARLGNLLVYKGRWVSPRTRGLSLRQHVLEAIYTHPQPDWTLLATRLGEVLVAMPWSPSTAVLQGNLWLKAGNGPAAIEAYAHAQRVMAPENPQGPDVERQLARLRAGEPLASIEPLPSNLLE